MEVEITIGGVPATFTYKNTWVCLFTDAPSYDHLYVVGETAFVVFECRELLDNLLKLGFPIQVRPWPTPWDESAMEQYVHNLAADIDDELDTIGE